MNYFNNTSEIEAMIGRLIDKLDESHTEHLDVTIGDVRLCLDKRGAFCGTGQDAVPSAVRSASPAPAKEMPSEPIKEASPATSPIQTVNAPLLGIAFAAPSPEAPPFVKVGQTVKKGDIICIIEAMKVMNEIESDRDGVVSEILFENGKMVEFGQPLIELKA